MRNALASDQMSLDSDSEFESRISTTESEPRSERSIVGHSGALREVMSQVEHVAKTGATVLISGETGTGKELIARAVHDLSPRQNGAFVRLNCAAMPPGLLESELFGHERGAFTGAVGRRVGRFQQAHQGTLFLDEVGEMPLELQPKLLRVIQEGEFEALGSNRTLHSNARIVAATNRDLGAMLRDRAFREDLYYRLSVFPIHLPPLRERRDDIPLLVNAFVERFARQLRKDVAGVSLASMRVLQEYDWPGNIRQLQNVLERAVILATSPVLDVTQLGHGESETAPVVEPAVESLDAVHRAHILAVLRSTRGDFDVYHSYDANAGGAPTLRISELQWTADGWPLSAGP